MLRTQKMRYRYNCMKLAKIVIDPNFIVLLINQKAIDILGAGKKNMIGNNILLYLPNDIRLFLVLKIMLRDNLAISMTERRTSLTTT